MGLEETLPALEVWLGDAVGDHVSEGGEDDHRVHAGIFALGGLSDTDEALYRRIFDVNQLGVFLGMKTVAPGMVERGAGSIVNISSIAGLMGTAMAIAYGASKGGVAQLTRAMAEAWSADGVMCNALAPGFFPTELTTPVFDDPDAVDRLAAQTCVGRNGTLDDLTGPALFFASRASDYVTGQVLYVDGGFTAK